jgi:hypothetical protein
VRWFTPTYSAFVCSVILASKRLVGPTHTAINMGSCIVISVGSDFLELRICVSGEPSRQTHIGNVLDLVQQDISGMHRICGGWMYKL